MLHLKSRFCDGIVYLSFRFDWCPRGRGAEGCGGRRRRTGGSPSAGGLLTTGFLTNPPTKSKFRGPKKNTSQVWRVSPVRGKRGVLGDLTPPQHLKAAALWMGGIVFGPGASCRWVFQKKQNTEFQKKNKFLIFLEGFQKTGVLIEELQKVVFYRLGFLMQRVP